MKRPLPWSEPWTLARLLAGPFGREGLVLLEGDGSALGRRAVLGVAPVDTVVCRGLPGDAGAVDPFAALAALQANLAVTPGQTAFVGDDLNDLAVRSSVGLLIATADAVAPLRRRADWVLDRNGGDGAVRRLSEAILQAQGQWRELAQRGWRDRND